MGVVRTDKVYSGTMGNVESTVGTISADTTFIMKGFFVSNANSSDRYFTMKIDDKRLAYLRTNSSI